MKIAVISRSANHGGAAIAARRLAEALRQEGAEASLVTLQEIKDDGKPFPLFAKVREEIPFIEERIQILCNNRFSLKNLWKTDTGSFGLPIWENRTVKEADAIILNWTNQGMLSLKGIGKLCNAGKKVIWTMHDMWPFTGICHHAMECCRFKEECGCCPYLKSHDVNDLSHRIWKRKHTLYENHPIIFVAVSNWLAGETRKSKLLCNKRVEVIPNPFKPVEIKKVLHKVKTGRILFAAAGLDNWIKGLDTFKQALHLLYNRGIPIEAVLMGALKNPKSLEGFHPVPVRHLGTVTGEENIAGIYGECDVVVNCSSFENLPGTIIEGEAYGAVPVAFDRGGQRDIIDHLQTGYMAPWNDSTARRAKSLADGIEWALNQGEDILPRMRKNVENKFSYSSIARKYIDLIEEKC